MNEEAVEHMFLVVWTDGVAMAVAHWRVLCISSWYCLKVEGIWVILQSGLYYFSVIDTSLCCVVRIQHLTIMTNQLTNAEHTPVCDSHSFIISSNNPKYLPKHNRIQRRFMWEWENADTEYSWRDLSCHHIKLKPICLTVTKISAPPNTSC